MAGKANIIGACDRTKDSGRHTRIPHGVHALEGALALEATPFSPQEKAAALTGLKGGLVLAITGHLTGPHRERDAVACASGRRPARSTVTKAMGSAVVMRRPRGIR